MAKIKLFIVPHTHYDAEVFLTRDATLKWGSEHILDALYLLDTDPDYRFTLDQRCYVEGFAALHPEQLARLKTHVTSGRVELAGGMHAMPDVNLPSGESLVRQVLYGQDYFEKTFGVRSKHAWMLDIFGHHPQVPQIIKKAGFDSYVFCRGVNERDHAGFNWVGLDGSKMRCEWLTYHYSVIGIVPHTLPEFKAALDAYVFEVMPNRIQNNNLVALAGLDLHTPDAGLPDMVRQYNAAQDKVEVALATFEEYMQAQAGMALPEIGGDLNPLFTGCYSARILVKQHNRELENKLFTAEKLLAANWAEASQPAVPVASLEAAWEPVLFNQSHDSICGSHIDASYERIIDRFKRADKIVGQISTQALDTLTAQINTQGDGLPLVVVNTLGIARHDVARCTLGLAGQHWHTLSLYDHTGNRVAVQLENVLRHPDGSIKRADLIFVADVPSLGYATYFVREGGDGLWGEQPKTDVWARGSTLPRVEGLFFANHDANDGWMGNAHVSLHVNLRSGAIRSLKLLGQGSDYEMVAPHELGFGAVCRQEDRGDPWEYYGPLRGDIMTAVNVLDPVPGRGERRAIFSDEYGAQGRALLGPVMASMHLSAPFGDGTMRTRIRVYAGLPRVEIETEIVNQQPFVRYRNVFPLNLQNAHITHEIPFGAIERPQGEFPAQNWVDVNDGTRGMALLNRGIPGHALIGNVLTSSLMKCAKVVGYGAAGGYDPTAKDEAGFEIGMRHTFHQALLPHTGDWRDAQLVHEGMAFNAPLIVHKCEAHAGALPPSASFVEIEPEHVALHALFVDEGQLVLRVVESKGAPVSGKITLRWPIARVVETDLIGGNVSELSHTGSSFAFAASPFEIKTFRVSLMNRWN